jgi:four helix bundle protein
MARTAFEDLHVYRLSEDLADQVWEFVSVWPAFAQRTVGEQLVDAADSIGANIAEGAGRYTFKENRRFTHIARGSLYETKHFLRRAFRRKLLRDLEIARLKVILDELAPRLNAYINSLATRTVTRRTAKSRTQEISPTTNNDQRTTNP